MSLLKVNEIQIFNGETVTITAPAVVTANDNTNAALRITQTGSGNALVVEDSSPDSTPFVVDASGRLIVGTSSVSTNGPLADIQSEIYSESSSETSILLLHKNSPSGIRIPNLEFRKTHGGAIVLSDNTIGRLRFTGFDGSNAITAGLIDCAVDGTPSTNDMPGRLVFSTTADGSSSPTERMRIDSDGNIGIGTTNPNSKLNVSTNSTDAAVTITQTGTGNALVVEDDSGNPDSTPFVVNNVGRVGIGTTSPVDTLDLGSGSLRVSNDQGISFGGTFCRITGSNSAQRIVFYTNDTEAMRIDSSGNVGIGTGSPSQKLDVAGNINATGALTLGTALAIAEGGTGVTALSSLDVADLGSGSAIDGYVLTADGAGGTAWEAASGGGGGTTAYLEHSSTISDSFTVTSGTNRMYIGGTTFSGTITVAGRLAIVAGPANFTGTINVTGTLATV